MALDDISIHLDGLGHLIADKAISVPTFQRSYAWEDKHVRSLLQDIGAALRTGQTEYFLGSIVAAPSTDGTEVVDGQQRLATTAILLAAIRDYFSSAGDSDRAKQIETTYLITKDFRTQEPLPRLRLNSLDRDFFVQHVLLHPSERKTLTPERNSHKRIARAAQLAAEHVGSVAATTNTPTEVLADWLDFITHKARVIWVEVPDHANAFTIFETLNDRGLDLAISDLLKNFLFNLAGDRINEAQAMWTEMIGWLVAVDAEDQVVNFIRHVWSSQYGLTREKKLFGAIKGKITSKQAAVDLAKKLNKAARLYAAILNPDHDVWNPYGSTARGNMTTLNTLRMTQMRPMILAILTKFEKASVKQSMQMLVSWAVRSLISGELGSSTLEDLYSEKAKDITADKIGDADGLAAAAKSSLPNDIQFREAFRTARVSKSYLARYYLQGLERQRRGKQPQLIANPNPEEVNLEHILPQSPDPTYWTIDPEQAEAHCNRLGNLVLLTADENNRLGNGSFEAKRAVFKTALLTLTSEVAKFSTWGPKQIDERQTRLAELAVAAWPI